MANKRIQDLPLVTSATPGDKLAIDGASTRSITVEDALGDNLVAIQGLTSAANKGIQFSGAGTASTFDLSAAGKALIDDADATAQRATLGLVIGTNVQAFDSDLAALAANAGTGLWSVTGAGTGSVRTITAPAAGITVTNGGGVAGNPTLALADDLAAVEGLATTGIVRRTGTSAWSAGTAVALTEMATQAAYTFVGNNTGSAAAPTAVDIATLTAKASPAAGDYLILSDQAASGAWKRATVSSIASAGSVSSIAGNTGAFTLANGIDNSANQIQLTAARRTLPTRQVFLSSSGTYTTPANCLWIEIEMVGGGGGGAGGGSSGAAQNGGAGGNTTFATFTAGGGSGGTAPNGGAGGTSSGSPQIGLVGGKGGDTTASVTTAPSGAGGSSFFGGFGQAVGIGGNLGLTGAVNSGSGGSGATNGAGSPGGGGGAGAYVRTIINSPSATYSYAVGAGGTAGPAGTSGAAGGAGAAGIIIVTEHYGS